MKIGLRLGLFLVFSQILTLLSAQDKNIIAGKKGMYPSFVSFKSEMAPAFSRGTINFTDESGKVISREKARELSHQQDKFGMEHVRYQQYIKGIPVEHGIYVVHGKNGKVASQNGVWVKDIPTTIPSTNLKESAALEFALRFVNASKYKWQDLNEEKFLKIEQKDPSVSFFPKGDIVLYSGEEDVLPRELRPAYKFDIYASEPLSRQIIFVDAENGAILGKRELIHTTDATGSAVTGYSGTQSITTDKVSNTSYRLREAARGKGIITLNLKQGTSYNTAVDFTDDDNAWNNVNTNKDQYATDAHWGAEMTYDYYKSKYNRNSIDNNGFAIYSYVHYSKNYFNAFWDGSRMTYGDGSSTNGNKPLTSLDVCGHEITHGLTSKTSNLVYSNESGAMNEAFSDIFGTSIENFARPSNSDWLIGSDFYTIRSMINPNDYGDPDTYKGTNWYTGTSDNGGVHTNSGVLNYWFYLMVNGGNGTNDKGTSYNVQGLGWDIAGNIAYQTLTSYLTSTSKYADARATSIQVAMDFYPNNSNVLTQTINAWDAVGVQPAPPPPNCPGSDVLESNESLSTAKDIPLNMDNLLFIGSSTDKDWFTFTTNSTTGTNIRVDLTYLAADYDMKLYNSSGRSIATSQNSGTNDESIKLNTSTATKYYLQVYGYAGAFNPTKCYQLRVTTSKTALFNEILQEAIPLEKVNIQTQPSKISVYPNPAFGILKVDFPSDYYREDIFSLIDMTGREVMKERHALQSGFNHLEMNISSVMPGIYFLKSTGMKPVKVQVVK